MGKYFLSSWLICWISMSLLIANAQGQNGQAVAELRTQIAQAQSDTAKCELYQELVKQFIYSDLEKAAKCSDSMLVLAQKTGEEKWIWKAKVTAGAIKRFSGDFLGTDSLFRTLVKDAQSRNNNQQLMEAYYQLAAVNNNLSRSDQSLLYFQQILDLAENNTVDSAVLSKVYNGMGIIHKNTDNVLLAAEYIQRAITIDRETGNTSSLMIAYNSLGLLYRDLDSIELAKKYFSESLSLAKVKNNLAVISMQLRNLGVLAWMKEDYVAAKSNYLDALEIRKQAGNPLRILGSHYDLGELYTSTNEYDKGEYHYKEALKLSEEIGSIDSKARVIIGLALLFEKKGAFKEALAYSRQSDDLLDSISYVDVQKNVLELETKYETAKKELQIKDQNLLITKQTNQRYIYIGLIIFLVLLAISILAFMRQRIKAKQHISEQATELQQQRITELEKEQKILNMAGMIEGQEAERIRIAKDLHDGLGGLLTTIKTQVSNIQRDIDELEKLKPYEKANAMIDDACNEVRRISQNLMPDILRLEGIHGAVDAIVDQIEDTHGLQVQFISEIEELKMNEVKALFVFRIIQELTNNIIKHAKATTVKLKLVVSGDILQVEVEDDGVGFELNQTQKTTGIGLKSVASRVNYLNGKLTTESSLGKGTLTKISIPLDNRKDV